MMRKVLLFALPLLLLLGFAAPAAQARDYHRGRDHRGHRHGYVSRNYYGNGYNGNGYNRRGDYRRHHRQTGYWRNYHGRRYWYNDGAYYARPGGLRISIGL